MRRDNLRSVRRLAYDSLFDLRSCSRARPSIR